MAEAKQEENEHRRRKENEHRTQIKVAMIAAGGVIVAAALGLVGSVILNESDGQDRMEASSASATATASADYQPTTVYVTSVSTTKVRSPEGTQNRESVTWKFTGTVKPSPDGHGVVFVLGQTEDGSHSVNSNPVSIALDGAWVAVVGPIPKDLAWTMKWIVAYGQIAPRSRGEPTPGVTAGPGEPTPSVSGGPNQPSASESFEPEAVTEVPKAMLPPQSR